MEETALSEEFQAILTQACLFKIPKSLLISDENHRILNEADLNKRLLNSQELHALCAESKADPEVILNFQGLMDRLIEHARLTIKEQFPLLFEPNGALCTHDRSQACWRDLWHFLRITTYGAAIDDLSFCDPQGYAATMKLYRLLNVPADAMAAALIDMACTYRESLVSVGSSATALELISSLEHIHAAMQEARHSN